MCVRWSGREPLLTRAFRSDRKLQWTPETRTARNRNGVYNYVDITPANTSKLNHCVSSCVCVRSRVLPIVWAHRYLLRSSQHSNSMMLNFDCNFSLVLRHFLRIKSVPSGEWKKLHFWGKLNVFYSSKCMLSFSHIHINYTKANEAHSFNHSILKASNSAAFIAHWLIRRCFIILHQRVSIGDTFALSEGSVSTGTSSCWRHCIVVHAE